MALFDFGREKREAEEAKVKMVEDQIMQALAQCELLDMVIDNLLEDEENPWITTCQSYYDDCKRVVSSGVDMFEVKWFVMRKEPAIVGYDEDGKPIQRMKDVEEILGRVGYSYTKSGYMPLHEYRSSITKNEKTGEKVVISAERMCELWVAVVRERMQAKMPACYFGSPVEAMFAYQVPRLTWKEWF